MQNDSKNKITESGIKFVNKANMFCVSYIDQVGKQKQEWFMTKEEAQYAIEKMWIKVEKDLKQIE